MIITLSSNGRLGWIVDERPIVVKVNVKKKWLLKLLNSLESTNVDDIDEERVWLEETYAKLLSKSVFKYLSSCFILVVNTLVASYVWGIFNSNIVDKGWVSDSMYWVL